MTLTSILLVFLGSGLGGVVRYLISYTMLSTTHPHTFPKATFCINLIACILLGLVLAVSQHAQQQPNTLYLLFGIGFCGGMSTFSTLSIENVQLLQEGHYVTAIMYTLGSIVFGILLAALAYFGTQKLL